MKNTTKPDKEHWRVRQQIKCKDYVVGNIGRIFKYCKAKETYNRTDLDRMVENAKQTKSYKYLKNYNKSFVDGYILAMYETML